MEPKDSSTVNKVQNIRPDQPWRKPLAECIGPYTPFETDEMTELALDSKALHAFLQLLFSGQLDQATAWGHLAGIAESAYTHLIEQGGEEFEVQS